MSPDETRAAAIEHLEAATRYPAGSPEERYHSSAAATLAQVYAADSNRRHADAVDRAAEIQAHMAQVTERFIVQNEEQQPVEDAAARPSGDR